VPLTAVRWPRGDPQRTGRTCGPAIVCVAIEAANANTAARAATHFVIPSFAQALPARYQFVIVPSSSLFTGR